MSLGGLTSLALAARRPDLVRKLVLVDVTPGVDRGKAKAIIDFVNGPQTFPSFDDIMKRTSSTTRRAPRRRCGAASSTTPASSTTARGRGATTAASGRAATLVERIDTGPLWDDLSSLTMPLVLARGALSPVVDDNDVAEVRRRQPSAEVVVFEGAGHSIQGDKPLELAALIERFAFSA